MSGVKGKSGRKRKTLTSQRAIQILTQKLPRAIEIISETMEGEIVDRLRYEAAIEVKDRVIGKPKASTALEIPGISEIGAGTLVKLFQMMSEYRKEIIAGETKLLPKGDVEAGNDGH